MNRQHLFEFEDLPWMPIALRQGMTGYFAVVHRLLGTHKPMVHKIAVYFAAGSPCRIIDCCSGGGGPLQPLVESLRNDYQLDIDAVLTDLYPSPEIVRAVNAAGGPVRYYESPVDVTNIPEELSGFRTLICGFHHLEVKAARAILEDCFRKRQPIAVFEITENCWPALLATMFVPLIVVGLMPLVRPMRWSHLVCTYLIPLLPALIFWDAAVSNLRTYSVEELNELVAGLDAADYQWEIGRIQIPRAPYQPPYLIGSPCEMPD